MKTMRERYLDMPVRQVANRQALRKGGPDKKTSDTPNVEQDKRACGYRGARDRMCVGSADGYRLATSVRNRLLRDDVQEMQAVRPKKSTIPRLALAQ